MVEKLTAKHMIFRGIADKEQCMNINMEFFRAAKKSFDLDLPGDDDLGNVLYKSSRSKGLQYQYLHPMFGLDIQTELKRKTGIDFSKSINFKCLPTFRYSPMQGEIKAHRDTDRTLLDKICYPKYVAVLMLTQRGRQFLEGNLYINEKAKVSLDGKTVANDHPEDRIMLNLNQGDIAVFDNSIYIHGVTACKPTFSSVGRMTCGWRSTENIHSI